MEPTTKKWKTEKTKKLKNWICSEVSVNTRAIHEVSPEEEKEGYRQ